MGPNRPTTIATVFPVIPTAAGRLSCAWFLCAACGVEGPWQPCRVTQLDGTKPTNYNRHCFSCHPDRSRPPFLRMVSMRGLRSGGTMATLPRNSARWDQTDQLQSPLFFLSSRPQQAAFLAHGFYARPAEWRDHGNLAA